MSDRLLDKRWPWIATAIVLLLVVLLSTFVDVRIGNDWNRRPVGAVEDIEGLQFRKDLNVLFILVDTLRADHIGSYGYERDTTPALDRLADDGVRFARQLSQSSWTKSSMVSLWTGLYPRHTGITRYDGVLPGEAVLASEVLQEAGFQTIGLWRNGWLSTTFGFGQGFDVYQRPLAKAPPPELRRENPTLSDRGTDDGLIDVAREFLRTNGDDPWFLYLHMMDLHEYIYDSESALFGNAHADLYDNSIRFTDRTIEILLEVLDDLGMLDDTLIAIASDHGEAFLERGFEGHAREVYRETTEVPFILSFPFRLDPGIVVEARTQNVDIWPTLLDLLGLEIPGDVDGRSRMPEILAAARGEPPPGSEGEIAISDLDQNWSRRDSEELTTTAIVDGPLRYVRTRREQGEPLEQLFDASNDPLERKNRGLDRPEELERLRAIAEEYQAAEPVWGEPETREISEIELNLLRALGYKIE